MLFSHMFQCIAAIKVKMATLNKTTDTWDDSDYEYALVMLQTTISETHSLNVSPKWPVSPSKLFYKGLKVGWDSF